MSKKGTTFLLCAALTLLYCPSARAADYFPSDPGQTFTYTYGLVEISGGEAGAFYRTFCSTCLEGSGSQFRIDASGDVCEMGYFSFQQAPWENSDSYYVYEPDLLYLDFPLEPGKEWQHTSMLNDYFDGHLYGAVTVHGRVVGPRTVVVPAGEFEVIEVALNYTSTMGWSPHPEVLWLHRQLGPVKDLMSWTGIVSTESTPWGSLKAMYR